MPALHRPVVDKHQSYCRKFNRHYKYRMLLIISNLLKMRLRFILSLLFVFVLSSVAYAQMYDIEGFVIDEPLTKAQLIQKFGQPDVYYTYDGTEGLGERILYGRNDIRIHNGVLPDFVVTDTTMAVCTRIVPGGIKVGMHASVLDDTVYGPIKSYSYDYLGTTRTEYYAAREDSDFLLRFNLDGNNIITMIFFSYPM